MEEKLFNDQQRRVIEITDGYHLVLAPPGCGKTAVLAERVVYAWRQGVAFADMACLTFTNRAARGMRERIMARCAELQQADQSQAYPSEDINDLFVGNVHRFCLHFLMDGGVVPEHSVVIDTDTSISIIADYLGEDELHALDDAKSRQRYSQIINLQHLMYQMAHGYPSRLIVHADAVKPADMNELCQVFRLPYDRKGFDQLYRQADHYRTEPSMLSTDARQLLQQLYAAYQYECYKQQNDLLDFEDLLLFTYDATSSHHSSTVSYDATLSHHSPTAPLRSFRWLQIDEVQDLNPLQLAVIDHFCAPDATVVYLGDAQQAIFSFMGAKTDTLAMLHQRCGDDHFHNFFQNYRSPQYLLDIFNRYAQWQLDIDPALLPSTRNQTARRQGDVVLLEAPTNIDEANMVARYVQQLYEQHPDETIAVVVAFNSDADEVSAALGKLPHFKISGADFFATPPVRLLLSHLGVAYMDHNFMAWSHILSGLHVYASNSAARQTVQTMRQLAISPADLLLREEGSYVSAFIQAWEQGDMVIFDTETTGLNVYEDDVVQIAAIRVRQGLVTDRLNLFLATDRPIPAMLGDVVNPLVEEYQHHEHLLPCDALEQFVRFAHGCTIVGHNVGYDYQIMEHNMRRRAPKLSMTALWPDEPSGGAVESVFDTLKLARLLHPRLQSYKLRHLLEQLELEGQNSHLADDDIMATLSLAAHCYHQAQPLLGPQLEFLSRHRRMAQRFRILYADLYRHTRRRLYALPDGEGQTPALAAELRYAYHYLLEQHYIPQLPKLDYIIRYVEIDMLTSASGVTLAEQLAHHYSELCTLKEADLCGSASMPERVFVSTVHKAKGLEFDSVIVYDAVDGKYPSPYARDAAKANEEARKFYVAISRARRRLIISYCHNAVSRWGSWYAKVLTPYMNALRSCF